MEYKRTLWLIRLQFFVVALYATIFATRFQVFESFEWFPYYCMLFVMSLLLVGRNLWFVQVWRELRARGIHVTMADAFVLNAFPFAAIRSMPSREELIARGVNIREVSSLFEYLQNHHGW